MATIETREYPAGVPWTFESDDLIAVEAVDAINAREGWEKYRVIG